jgi:uncharacterized membrane protein YedE/YeeE
MAIPESYALALTGGVMIGAAALLLYAVAGRIAGISGIVYGAVWQSDRAWRLGFIAALVAGGWLAALFIDTPPANAGPRWGLLIVAGLLVGAGTQLGNGCTSGHGVCGLARLSPRSLAAVAVFMGVGMLIATGARAWLT